MITKRVPDQLNVALHASGVRLACHTRVIDVTNTGILRTLESDFSERAYEEQAMMSQEDLRFLKTVEDSIRQDENGYYDMAIR